MNPFIRFVASTAGRIARAVLGVGLIAWGLLGLGDTLGLFVAVFGLVPLIAGVGDICVFAPLFKLSTSGKKIRSES